MTQMLQRTYSYILILALVACTAVPQPQSVQQGIAYGYSMVASVRNTAASLLNGKQISVADAKMVQATADQARAALDLATEATKLGKSADAQTALTLATNVLSQLQTFLKAKGG